MPDRGGRKSVPAVVFGFEKGGALRRPSACQKSLAEFAARRRQRGGIIFSRDMCVRENTSQAASVEFCRKAAKLCAQQTAILLSEKPGGFFDNLKGGALRRPFFVLAD